MNSIIEGLPTKLYIQCLFIKHNLYNTIKTPFNIEKLNALTIYFHDLYIQIDKQFIYIYKEKPILHKISFNKCSNSKFKQVCPLTNQSQNYQIIIYFKYPKNIKNIKKIIVPFVIDDIECSKKNMKKLVSLKNNLKKILKKDEFLKMYFEKLMIEQKN